ncbi:MAG: hypothetical protein J6A25_12680, partial [Lachnospiraceae bacterium]|nr:hypothetical protein [Lachnospiraceae bacterium]
EISLETKIKKENHEMLKWQSNVTTFEEGRRRMGLRDIPEDEERLFQRMIADKSSLDQIDRNGEWQEKIAHIGAAAKAANSSGSSSSKTSTSKSKSRNTSGKKQPSKAATNNNRPQNQHGTTSVKVKEYIDSDNKMNLLYRIYYNIPELNDHNMKNYQMILFNEIDRIIRSESLEAINEAVIEINNNSDVYHYLPNININYSSISKSIKDDIGYLLNNIKDESVSNKNISDCLINNSDTLNNIVNYYCQKIYNYSFIQTGKNVNVDNVFIKLNNEDEYKEANVDDFTLSSIFDSTYDNCVLTYDKSEVR